MFNTITEIKNANAENGGHWFDAASLRFFRSHVGRTVFGGKYFVSSEQFVDGRGVKHTRKHTIRVAAPDGSIDTVGEFQAYDTASQARAAIKFLIVGELATAYGFFPGKEAGYLQEGLYLRDSSGGGRVSVYPFRKGWTASFFGPNQNTPRVSKWFPTAESAFSHYGR